MANQRDFDMYDIVQAEMEKRKQLKQQAETRMRKTEEDRLKTLTQIQRKQKWKSN